MAIWKMKVGRHRFQCRLVDKEDNNYSWKWWGYEKTLPTSLEIKISRLEGTVVEMGFYLQEPNYTPISDSDPAWIYLIHQPPGGGVKWLYFQMPWPKWGDFLQKYVDKPKADMTISWLKYGF